jgi:integrase
MEDLGHNSQLTAQPERVIVLPEANSSLPLTGEDFQRMAKRRFQSPKPFREGNWWWIKVRQDQFSDGRLKRKQKRVKVGPATLKFPEARTIASEILRPMNQGLEVIGSATQFSSYVDGVYRGTVLPLLASTTGTVYCWVLDKYLIPTFGDAMLRDLNTMTLQKYFSGLGKNHATAMKVKDALGSVLSSALRFGLLSKNPLIGVQIPSPRVGKRTKPHITPEQFDALVNLVAEPYATMIYTCVMAGLRVSELVGLKWEDIHADSLTVDERFSRGEWGCPKTSASSATIGVDERVVERINRLKDMEVTINWGARGAKKTFKLVRSATPGDLVFQSLIKQGPMSDHNVLSRHIKPAARKLGIGWVNWQVLRRSYATWLVEAGADPKAVQAQMRHSRSSTTMDIYAQFVPAAQRRAVSQMMDMVTARMGKAASPSEMVN